MEVLKGFDVVFGQPIVSAMSLTRELTQTEKELVSACGGGGGGGSSGGGLANNGCSPNGTLCSSNQCVGCTLQTGRISSLFWR